MPGSCATRRPSKQPTLHHAERSKTPRRALRGFFSLLLAAALLQAGAPAAADDGYAAELIERARRLALAERPEWRKLLHYVPDLIAPGVHSQVDSPAFFVAAQGKVDPRAELEATLLAFFSREPETGGRQHPQCTFVARQAWLAAELGFDATRMPRPECRRYLEWRSALDARQLTLVFASAYLNNPGSMYGHTLLRVDARDQDERTRLLAYTINFAADTDETNGLVFAVKGLFGGYAGVYSVQPYYLKVRDYSDLENRDLWEYELDLGPEEVDRVLRHAWELLPTYFAYFFFDENCAYHLLGLLQVARPDLELTAPFRLWALPVDTVRALVHERGLVRKVVYRPATSTIIAGRLAGMSAEERRLSGDLGRGTLSASDPGLRAMPAERAAAVIEAGHDYLNYRRTTGSSEVSDGGALARELLVARSELAVPSQAPRLESGTRPEQGHATSRVALGAGRRQGAGTSGGEAALFVELGLRPTYHDIVDDDAGYIRGAQIEFFHLRARRYEGGEARIESLIPVDIFSLSPRDEFFQPKSWRVAAGWRRMQARDGSEPLAAMVDGSLGGAWAAGASVRAYAMAEGTVAADHHLESGYTVAAGPRVGALFDPSPRWRLHAYAQALGTLAGERWSPQSAVLEQRLTLAPDAALRFALGRYRESGRSFSEALLSIHLYF